MPMSLFLAYVHLFCCLLNQEFLISAQEIPVKRVSKAKNTDDERFFYIQMESLFAKLVKNSRHKEPCGATFYSQTVVISAGHCVKQDLKVFLKATLFFRDYRISIDAMSAADRQRIQSYTVEPSQVHYYNDKASFSHRGERSFMPDIAVLYIQPNFYESLRTAFILPICSEDFFLEVRNSGILLSFVGMGLTEYDNRDSHAGVLQEATMQVTRTQNPCKELFDRGEYDDIHVLCAVGVSCIRYRGQPMKLAYNNKKRPCFGDTGGPLFHKYKDGTAHCLIGIANREITPIPKRSRTTKEKISPFHDGSGSAEAFTSLADSYDWLDVKGVQSYTLEGNLEYRLLKIQQWNDDQIKKASSMSYPTTASPH